MNADENGGKPGTHLDFATCTIERRDVVSTPGNELITRVRTVSSVADAGKEDRNNDIWVYVSHRKSRHRSRTYDRFVFWRLQTLLIGMSSQDFTRYGVIVPEIPILNVLLRQLGLLWYLVSIRKRSSYGAGGKKDKVIRTDMGTPCPDCSPPLQRTNIHVAGCAYNKARSARAA
jgi:hypothetical protein